MKYLQILLSVHRLQVVVCVCVDLERFSMEEHLHCDEVCENPLPKKIFKKTQSSVCHQSNSDTSPAGEYSVLTATVKKDQHVPCD